MLDCRDCEVIGVDEATRRFFGAGGFAVEAVGAAVRRAVWEELSAALDRQRTLDAWERIRRMPVGAAVRGRP